MSDGAKVLTGDLEDWEDGGLGLPEGIWHRVAAFLHVHELLGRLVILSAGHAAVLTDEGCWGTLALPPGPTRLGHMLWLMLLEERELWVPLLHKVQNLDLDLQSSTSRTVDHLRDLLLHGLSIDSSLRNLRVHRLPVRPAVEPGSEAPAKKFTKSDLTLVNPVRNAPKDRRLFLLDPQEFGRLRLLMVHFRHLRIRPSAQCLDPSVDILAQHQPPCGEPAAWTPGSGEDAIEALMMTELGALRELPPEAFSGGSGGSHCDFDSWLSVLRPRYQLLLSGWE